MSADLHRTFRRVALLLGLAALLAGCANSPLWTSQSKSPSAAQIQTARSPLSSP
ncbi:MAG: hypothetical protein PSW75_02550 [bacterium]|nr:hypothetical protein [bacterium]MDI1337050.1 hypothetical protein [Lacunisphaera sp.]